MKGRGHSPVLFLICVSVFLTLTGFWHLYHGEWQCLYSTESGDHMLHLETSPVWAAPAPQTEADFREVYFKTEPFPEGGQLHVVHSWERWTARLLLNWFFGSLIIAPVGILGYSTHWLAGSIGRIAAGLAAGGLICLILYLFVGGWGPPAPLFFLSTGVILGCIWTLRSFIQSARLITSPSP